MCKKSTLKNITEITSSTLTEVPKLAQEAAPAVGRARFLRVHLAVVSLSGHDRTRGGKTTLVQTKDY